MKKNLKLSQKVLLLITVPLAFELIFVSVLLFSLMRLEGEHARSEQMRSASMFFNIELENLIEAMGSMVLFNVLHETKYLKQFEGSVNTLQIQNEHLKALAGSEMAADVQALKSVSSEAIAGIGDFEKLARTDDRIDMLRGFMKVKNLLAKSSQLGSAFIAREAKSSQEQQERQRTALQIVIATIVIGVGVSILISVWLVSKFNSGAAKQLKAIDKNMTLLAAQKPLNEPLAGGDELARIDQTLVQMSNDLQALKSEQQQVYAMITHDLRSPLASVKVLFDLLAAGALGELNDKGRERIKSADSILNRMVALTNDLLDVEKFESGNFNLNLEEVHLNQLFLDSKAIVLPRAEAKSIEIKIDQTNLSVVCDRERIGRVIVNFMDNAIKFSPKHGAIRLSASTNGTTVKVSVQDGGQGIPDDQVPYIFERFRQVNRADETVHKGSGLGLAISKAIVEAHHGTIGVDSKVNRGSTFWFTLSAD